MKYKKLESAKPVEPATSAEALKFIEGLQQFRTDDDKSINVEAVREYINKFPLGSLQGYARRIMMDIMKGHIDDELHSDAAEPQPKDGDSSSTDPDDSASGKTSQKQTGPGAAEGGEGGSSAN